MLFTPNTNALVNLGEASGMLEEMRAAELRYNPYHDPLTGQFTSGGGGDLTAGGGGFGGKLVAAYSNGGAKPVDKKENIDYNKINEEIQNNPIINSTIGEAEKPVPIEIKSVHPHAQKMMAERNISLNDAQEFVDTSIIAFNQNTAEAFYADSGVSVVKKADNKLITTFSKNDFDEAANEIIKVAKKYDK